MFFDYLFLTADFIFCQNILDVYRKQLDSEQRSFTDAQCELEKLNGDFKDAKKYRENALERKIKLLVSMKCL